MVRLKVQEDNIKLKMNAPDGATFRTNELTPIMQGSTDYNDLDNKPSINGNTLEGDMTAEELGIHMSDLINDDGYLKVTDLGVIDGDQYDWDVEEYLNTLQETGSYTFLWDEFKYFVDIKAVEVDGVITAQQIFWGTEEGSGATSYRNIVVEGGEVVQQQTITYLTFQEANTAFARNTHVHYRTDAKAVSVWDFCNTVALENANPIVIYFDLSTNKTYMIETYVGVRQPVYKMQKVTEMNDVSCFYQRSSYYYSGREHWGNWYKFTGTIFDPSGR